MQPLHTRIWFHATSASINIANGLHDLKCLIIKQSETMSDITVSYITDMIITMLWHTSQNCQNKSVCTLPILWYSKN
jgi:hypothetical protein